VLLSQLGAGAMGTVYRAQHMRLGRDVALKLLHPSLLHTNSHARFIREMKLLSELNHPNIVRMLDADPEGEVPYVAMELLEGTTLESHMASGKPAMTNPARLRMCTELASGIAFMHAHGILHRDLKPANVMIDLDGTAKITDFGLARTPDSTKVTQSHHSLGTPLYMAPEVLTGSPATAASDLWSLGCIFYQLLCGRLHIIHTDKLRWMSEVHHQAIVPPIELESGCDPALSKLTMELLVRDPAQRLDRAEAVAARLRAIGDATPSRPAQHQSSSVQWGLPRISTIPGRSFPYGHLMLLGLFFSVVAVAHWMQPWEPGIKIKPSPQPSSKKPNTFAFWNEINPWLSELSSSGDKSVRRAVLLDQQSPVPLGKDPSIWLAWARVGSWLRNPSRGTTRTTRRPSPDLRDLDALLLGLDLREMRRVEPGPGTGSDNRSGKMLRVSLTWLSHDFENPNGWLLLGWFLDHDGQLADAKSCYRMALDHLEGHRFPCTSDVLWSALARALVRTGRALSFEWPRWHKQLGGCDAGWIGLVGGIHDLKESDGELGQLLTSSCGLPEVGPAAVAALAILQRNRGDWSNAVRSFKDGLARYPESESLREDSRETFLGAGRFEELGHPRTFWEALVLDPRTAPPVPPGAEIQSQILDLRRQIEFENARAAKERCASLLEQVRPETLDWKLTLDLCGAGVELRALAERARALLSITPANWEIWDRAAGALTRPGATPNFELLIDTLPQSRNRILLTALGRSRAARTNEAVAMLKSVVNDRRPGDPGSLDRRFVTEIIARGRFAAANGTLEWAKGIDPAALAELLDSPDGWTRREDAQLLETLLTGTNEAVTHALRRHYESSPFRIDACVGYALALRTQAEPDQPALRRIRISSRVFHLGGWLDVELGGIEKQSIRRH
jgi:serine/threonine protein kinase/tetratricopeptide (TPR) repeat protein